MILSIETSMSQCAVALVDGDQVLAAEKEDMSRGQGEALFPMVDRAMGAVAPDNLTLVAVCTGPGNFTGIRIGVSAARAIGLGLDCPVIGVSALEVQAFGTKGDFEAKLSAPRDQVYHQWFRDGIAAGEPELLAGSAPAFEVDPVVLARVAAGLGKGREHARPLYVRPPDAAISSERPPAILG